MKPFGLAIVLLAAFFGALALWTYTGQPAISQDFSIPPACAITTTVTYLPTGAPNLTPACNGLYSLLIGGTIAGLVGSMLTARPTFYRLKARREN